MCDALAVSGLRVRVGNAAHSGIAAGFRLMAPLWPWTTAEVSRLRRAYYATPSALCWRSSSRTRFPAGRSTPSRRRWAGTGSTVAGRMRRPVCGVRRPLLTIEQIRWLDRRFGGGRRSEGLRDIITAAMAADKIARGQSPEAGEDKRAGGVATPGAARVSETRPVA